jgi:hypothetical protein
MLIVPSSFRAALGKYVDFIDLQESVVTVALVVKGFNMD